MQTIRWAKWLVAACLLGGGIAAHAEGGCPEGQYPASGQGWQTCYPMPSYDQQQSQTQAPPEQWVDHWGAIATDAMAGVLGISTNTTDRNQAVQTALLDCQTKGGKTCKIETAYRNSCGAVVVGDKGYVVTSEPALDKAVQAGINTCGDAANHCHVYYSACSLPKRVK